MGILAAIGVVSPFPFYYWLWTSPQTWVALFSTLSWPPPLYFWHLIVFGQFLNFRVYQLLGEAGTYYGVRFGKDIPWVTEFPFGYIKDPQYIGSIASVFACLSWVPLQYIILWTFGYVFMIQVESKEDPTTCAKP